MALKSAKAFYGLQGVFDLTSAATTGEAIVGQGSTPVTLPTTGQAWAVEIEVDGAGEVEINLEIAAVTVTGAGTAQVETATAAGTVSAAVGTVLKGPATNTGGIQFFDSAGRTDLIDDLVITSTSATVVGKVVIRASA